MDIAPFLRKAQKNKRGIERRSLKLTQKRKRINVSFILIGFVVLDDEGFGRLSVQKMVFHAHHSFREKSVFKEQEIQTFPNRLSVIRRV